MDKKVKAAAAELEQEVKQSVEEIKPAVEKAEKEVKEKVSAAKSKAVGVKKAAVKKVAKAADSKPVVYVQYQGGEANVDSLLEAAVADFRKTNKRAHISALKLYVKPEEHAAYYVINDKAAGKVDF